ncbi:MAG: FkbM family methyltransferase [Opitutaceae bacterium]|nr:FkbM family methyltransferase [Opitutaceae bacterium]
MHPADRTEATSAKRLPWGWRFRHECAFLFSRWRGRPYRLQVTIFGCPLVLSVESRREIKRAGEFALEAALMERLLGHVRPGDTVYDVGANIGLISLIVALHPAGRACRVFSFEPEPRNVAELGRNIVLNGLADRVSAQAVALGSKDGEAALFVRGPTGDGRHSLVDARGAKDSVTVRLLQATTFARESGAPPDVVKIDVEGAEGEVLAGMDGLTGTGRPREILMEIHAKGGRDRMPDGTAIHDWLVARGYELAWEQNRRSGLHRHYRRAG